MTVKPYNVDPAYEFDYELSFITDDMYSELAIRALFKAPDYFWFAPASASGKYHPKSSLGMGGLVRHVKSVFWILFELINHPSVTLTDGEKSQALVAALLHDCCKQGTENSGTHTVHIHPLLVRDNLKPTGITPEMEAAWDSICDIIESHMGPWNKDTKGESDVILPTAKTEAQKLLHTADYIASRKIIEVDITQRSEQLGYKKPDPVWKAEPATEGMIGLIAKLFRDSSAKGFKDFPNVVVRGEDGAIVLTKGEAGDIIDTWKIKLGWN